MGSGLLPVAGRSQGAEVSASPGSRPHPGPEYQGDSGVGEDASTRGLARQASPRAPRGSWASGPPADLAKWPSDSRLRARRASSRTWRRNGRRFEYEPVATRAAAPLGWGRAPARTPPACWRRHRAPAVPTPTDSMCRRCIGTPHALEWHHAEALASSLPADAFEFLTMNTEEAPKVHVPAHEHVRSRADRSAPRHRAPR